MTTTISFKFTCNDVSANIAVVFATVTTCGVIDLGGVDAVVPITTWVTVVPLITHPNSPGESKLGAVMELSSASVPLRFCIKSCTGIF